MTPAEHERAHRKIEAARRRLTLAQLALGASPDDMRPNETLKLLASGAMKAAEVSIYIQERK